MEGVSVCFPKSSAGNHMAESATRIIVGSFARSTRAAMKAGAMLAEDDLARLPTMVAANVHHLASFGIAWAFPDPGELYPEAHLEWFVNTWNYQRDHAGSLYREFDGARHFPDL